MEDRRKYGRVRTEGKVTVDLTDLVNKAEMTAVSTIDISPGGISFICDKDLPPGSPMKLSLNFPGIYVEKDIPVMAKIVHSHKVENKFKVGCCYVGKETQKTKV